MIYSGLRLTAREMRYLRRTVILALLAIALPLALLRSPELRLFIGRPEDYLTLHLLMGLFSVVISLMAATMAWNALEFRDYSVARPLVFCFTLIAGCDLIHVLMYPGMPSFIVEGNLQIGMLTRLSGRLLEVLALTLILFQVGFPGPRWLWLVLGWLGVSGMLVLSVNSLDWLPGLFEDGRGLTLLARSSEYLLGLANLLLVGGFAWRYLRRGERRWLWLGMGALLIGIGELLISGFKEINDLLAITAHSYTLIAYFCLYRAIFLAGLREPYVMLAHSELKGDETAHELEETLREMRYLKMALDTHAIVAFTDARGIITRVNQKFCEISKYSAEELVGKTHRVINSGHHPKSFFADMWQTIAAGKAWTGEVCNRAKDGSLYWVHTTIVPFIGISGKPEQYVAIRADVTLRKQAEAEARHLAFHDALTGLPNRLLMLKQLAHAIELGARNQVFGAVLLLDLDHFKEINDTLGHDQGDELLRTVARRLARVIRQSDTAARLGGDEFVVILEDIGADQQQALINAGNIAEKVRSELAGPCQLGEHEVLVTPSIGVVLFHSRSDEPVELVKQADIALYKAKEGRNQVCFFDPELQAQVVARAQMLNELRFAEANGELRLYYQPLVDARRRVIGVEALLRWLHPQHGLVSPALFIPLAEQSGQILSLGQWVLEQACRQLTQWRSDPLRCHWGMSVNVSARQLGQDDFVEQVQAVLAHTGAPAERLRLELTESMLQEQVEETIVKMKALRALGIRFSLDDFGTGYSSLSYLKSLPLDRLKIDKSFVSDVLVDPDDAAIARTIIALADSLELEVVAEGVETREQMEFLLDSGCSLFQGYLFGRPVPVDQLPAG